jgi:endonuclease/exonuclease/phosphatase family metal-dependent hydrolase
MGFDAEGIPDPPGIARAIEAADADVVGLEEVGRGWTVNGGADLFAWLRWRFPQYRALYGPMNGALWGNAILSRLPIGDQGSLRFPIRESKFQRGLTWVTLPTPRGDLLVIATHFANEEAAEGDRLGQAGDLLAFWRSRPCTVIMGDFNAEPDSAPITRVLASGLRDALAPHGLAAAGTYPSPSPAIRRDYVFITADIESVAGRIPKTIASDHLPVAATLRVR